MSQPDGSAGKGLRTDRQRRGRRNSQLFSGICPDERDQRRRTDRVAALRTHRWNFGYRYFPSSSPAYRKSRTMYALTNRRVLVLCGLPKGTTVKSLPLQFLTSISIDTGYPVSGIDPYARTKRGTVTFQTSCPRGLCSGEAGLRFFMTSSAEAVADMAAKARSVLCSQQVCETTLATDLLIRDSGVRS